MESYRSNISAFAVCDDHPCLLFKEVGSYISVHAQSFTRYPFKCRESLTKYGKILHGPYFYFIQNIPVLEDAYCVYVGDECSYDNQVEFLTDISDRNENHQFIVAGHMFIMSYRISNDSIPSAPYTHGPILLVGPLATRHVTLKSARDVVAGPFETSAWIFIIIILLLYAFVRICIPLIFTFPFRWGQFWWNIWGEYEEVEQERRNENAENNQNNRRRDDDDFQARFRASRERLIFYNKYWTFAAKLFLVLTIIFYELALFNHVFEILDRPPRKNIEGLSVDEMKQFVIVRNSGYEGYFRLAADPKKQFENADDSNIPWQRVS